MASLKEQKIEAAMQGIAAKFGDHLTADDVVREVRKLPRKHPIHERFMGWDKKKLAEAKALDIARELIGQYLVVQVTRYSTVIPGKAFIRDPDAAGNIGGFVRAKAMSKRQALAVLENEVSMVECDVAAARIRIASMPFPELIDEFEKRLRALFPPIVVLKPKKAA